MSAPAAIRVFTFKEGLLSRIAHDLQLSLGDFALELSAGGIKGSCQMDTLRVQGAVVRGRLDPSVLSAGDRSKIERSMREEVLRSARFPTARLEARLTDLGQGRFHVAGELELAGRSARLEAELRAGERITGRFPLQPSRWGIKPFRALGGALKIEDRVEVEVNLPADVQGFDAERPLETSARWP